nr:Serine threonine protein kinase-related domain containing protein [Haemonchus contortus]
MLTHQSPFKVTRWLYTMTLPVFAKKVKKLASFQLFNLKLLLNGESSRGFNKFKKHYKLKGELGRGGFGIVYRAIRVSDELPVAVKFIDRRTVREWGKINDEHLPMEICMLAKCSKIRGVIRLLDWYSIPEGYLIVMERPYPCVDMFDFIKGQQKLDEEMARFLFRQIAQTLNECSQKRVLHRDLKDENVVIDLVTGDTKLIDFGAATVLKKSHYTDFQGTRLYCPPEWFLHSLYLGREAAVWSLGVLLYNALNGRLPFRNEKDICTAHLLGPLPFFTTVSPEAKDLIARCLQFDPFSRCTIEDILRHPWVTKPTADWLTLSAAAGKAINEKEAKDDEREHSEELEEIGEEVEHEDVENHDDEEGDQTSEDESGVGSLASTSTGKPNHQDDQPRAPVRFSKTSLLAPPNSDDLKAVVQASKTTSVYHDGPKPIRPSRRRVPPPSTAVLAALRRAVSRDRQIRN